MKKRSHIYRSSTLANSKQILIYIFGLAAATSLTMTIKSTFFSPEPIRIAEIDECPTGLDCSIPQPVNLAFTCSADNTHATLSWDNNSPGKYLLRFNDPANDTENGWFIAGSQDIWRGGDLANNTYDATVTPSKEYDWSVQNNASGPGSAKSRVTWASLICGTPIKPPIPTNIQAKCSANGTRVTLSWDDVSPSMYSLLLNDPANDTVTDFVIPGSTDLWRGGDLDSNSLDATILPDHEYEWWVASNNNGPSSTNSDQVRGKFKCSSATPPPSVPLSLRNDKISCNSLAFSWDKVSGAHGYIIDLADNSDFNDKLTSGTLGSDQTSFTFNSLKANTNYYTRITQTDINDFPHYTKLPGITTTYSCTSPAPVVVRPSPRPSLRPSPSPELASPEPSPLPSPSTFTMDDSNNAYALSSPVPSDAPNRTSIIYRILNWIKSLFD